MLSVKNSTVKKNQNTDMGPWSAGPDFSEQEKKETDILASSSSDPVSIPTVSCSAKACLWMVCELLCIRVPVGLRFSRKSTT